MEILYNARVHTLHPGQPAATALAIDRGRILAVGTDEEVLREFEGRGRTTDLEGRTVIPGLTDAHLHLKNYAFFLRKVNCETKTLAECLSRVQERARRTPPGQWILGHGWNQNDWGEGFGTAATLDRATPDHPVYLTAKSMHAGWANSAALKLAGISAQTPDPEGGQIQRFADGSPTGILLEEAMDLLEEVIPSPQHEEIVRAIQETQPELWKLGLTGIHDFDRRDSFAALQTLHNRGDLHLRVVKSIPLEDMPHAIATGLRSGFGDDYLRIGMVKAFADGALGPHTAAMMQPYEDEPGNTGLLLMDREEIFEHGRQAVQNGLGMSIHAIGDRANHEVLEAYAQLRAFEQQHHLPPARHRIEHVQVLNPDDLVRLAQLELIASMQPIHATSDMFAADKYWGDRTANAYAWRTLLESRTPLAFGSDAPVESPNPFWGLHAAVTRRRADGQPGPEGWHPEQRLTLRQALQGFTSGPAFAAGMEASLGKLAPGYLADLLVLEHDLFEVEPDHLREVRPLRTMVGGNWVWG